MDEVAAVVAVLHLVQVATVVASKRFLSPGPEFLIVGAELF